MTLEWKEILGPSTGSYSNSALQAALKHVQLRVK